MAQVGSANEVPSQGDRYRPPLVKAASKSFCHLSFAASFEPLEPPVGRDL